MAQSVVDNFHIPSPEKVYRKADQFSKSTPLQ